MSVMLLSVIFMLCSVLPPEKPEALRRMEASRMQFNTAHVEWHAENTDGSEFFFTSRFANGDQLHINHGDRDGLMYPNLIGKPFAASEDRLLLKDGEQWQHTQDTVLVSVYRDPTHFRAMFDVTTLGFVPGPMTQISPIHYLPMEPKSYSVRVNGSQHEVTGVFDNAGHVGQVMWVLDADKDYAPLRCSSFMEGAGSHECRCEYENYGGTWFPSQATYFVDGKQTKKISITMASFNDPDDPPSFSPNDLGLFPGVSVAREGEKYPRMWDGQAAIAIEDYFKKVKDGEVDNTRYHRFLYEEHNDLPGAWPKTLDDPGFGPAAIGRQPGLWEAYVRRFIQRYRLDTPQTRRAWKIHKECQSKAYKYLDSHRKELDDLDRAVLKARLAAKAKSATAVKNAEKRRDEKLAPVQRIFDESLKPRLDATLTPKQRASPPPARPTSK